MVNRLIVNLQTIHKYCQSFSIMKYHGRMKHQPNAKYSHWFSIISSTKFMGHCGAEPSRQVEVDNEEGRATARPVASRKRTDGAMAT